MAPPSRPSYEMPTLDVAGELCNPLFEEDQNAEDRRKIFERLQHRLACEQFTLGVRNAVALRLLSPEAGFVISSSMTDIYLPVLLSCGRHVSVTAALATLKSIKSFSEQDIVALDLCLLTIKRILYDDSCLEYCNTEVWFADWPRKQDEFQAVVRMWIDSVVLFPKTVSNACMIQKVSIPSWSTPNKYHVRLIRNALESFLRSVNLGELHDMYLEELVSSLLRQGSKLIVDGLFESMSLHLNDNDVTTRLSTKWRSLFSKMLPRDFARVAISTLHFCTAKDSQVEAHHVFKEWIDECIGPVVQSCEFHADALVDQAVLSKRPFIDGKRMLHHLVSLFSCPVKGNFPLDTHESSTVATDALLRHKIQLVGTLWAMSTFARQNPEKYQRHVTWFLLFCLRSLSQPKEDANSDMAISLLNGVTERLSSTSPSVRQDGMIIGEAVAERLGEELKFEEMEGYRQEFEIPQAGSPSVSKSATLTPQTTSKTQVKRRVPSRKIFSMDPDAEYHTEDEVNESDSDSTWDADSDIEDYGNGDLVDADLNKTPPPKYLTDCLDLLRASESDENAHNMHEVALKHLPQLVRMRPLDLPRLAHDLAFQLLRMEDKFHTDNFSELVSTGLLTLAAEEPVSVGRMIVSEVFGDMTLVDRLNGLQALEQAAMELAGLVDKPTCPDGMYQKSLKSTSDAEEQRNEAMNGSITSKFGLRVVSTRMRRSKRSAAKSSINHFSDIGPLWFYMMLKNFLNTKTNKRIWGGHIGATFLARLIHTLTVCVECSRFTREQSMMASDLIDLSWELCDADIVSVRSSSLFAVAVSIGHLEERKAIDMIASLGLNERLSEVALTDSDDECRKLANYMLSSTKQLIESTEPLIQME